MKRRLLTSSLSILVLVFGVLAGTASAVEPGQRLAGDEARASAVVTDPQFPCYTHDIWISALVGDAVQLGATGGPGEVSRLYGRDSVQNTCTGESQFFEGEVAFEPGQVEFTRLESFAVHDVILNVRSELGYVMWFTFDLTWTRASEPMNAMYRELGQPGVYFQVERWVMADVTGAVRLSDSWDLPEDSWVGDMNFLTQVGSPRP